MGLEAARRVNGVVYKVKYRPFQLNVLREHLDKELFGRRTLGQEPALPRLRQPLDILLSSQHVAISGARALRRVRATDAASSGGTEFPTCLNRAIRRMELKPIRKRVQPCGLARRNTSRPIRMDWARGRIRTSGTIRAGTQRVRLAPPVQPKEPTDLFVRPEPPREPSYSGDGVGGPQATTSRIACWSLPRWRRALAYALGTPNSPRYASSYIR